MSDPSKYTRSYSFTDYQASNPSAPLPGTQVDNELENVETSLGQAIDAIKDVRRSDGALKNGIVTVDSLSAQVAAGVGSGALASAEAAAASADAASDSAVAAMTARDLASQWAASENLVDDGLNTPGYSAKRWAETASATAIPPESIDFEKLSPTAIQIYDTVAYAAAQEIPAGVNAIRVNGRATAGDGGGGLFARSVSEPVKGPAFQTADGSWWAIEEKKAISSALFATLQDAILAASGAILLVPAGAYTATGLQGIDDVELVAQGRVIIKRPDDDPSGAAILDFSGRKNFKIVGDFYLHGNLANNTIAANCLNLDGCGNYEVHGVSCNFARGCGIVAIDSTDVADGTFSRITGSECNGNDQYGAYLLSAGNMTIDDNEFSGNTLNGLICDGTPGLTFKNFILTNNIATRNGQTGIFAWGHRDNDPGNTSLRNMVVTGNITEDNAEWGLAVQGFGMTVSANICHRNGSNGAHAGLLVNGVNIVALGNIIEENYYFGIDAGDARNIIIEANHVNYNGRPTIGGIGINIESSQKGSVRGNFLSDNGGLTVNTGQQIYLRGIGGADDASPFLQRLNGFDVRNNSMTVTHTGYAGLVVDADCDDVTLGTNPCYGFSTPGLAIVIQCETVTFDGKLAGDSTQARVSIPSAGVLVVPDFGDFFNVTGTTEIFNVRTERENFYIGKVRRITVPAGQGGSGYESSFDFVVPGGGGATARALVYGGAVVQIRLTAYGSGLSADFGGAVPGGTGTGANFFAEVGCVNSDGREIKLFMVDGAAFATGGNLGLSAPHAAAANAVLKLLGKYGNFYEESYRG